MFARILAVTLATAAMAFATSGDTSKSAGANQSSAAHRDTTMKAMGDSTHAMMHDSSHAAAQDTLRTMYTCPMHPQVMMKAPGKCPIAMCGMNLVPKKTAAADSTIHRPSERRSRGQTHEGHGH